MKMRAVAAVDDRHARILAGGKCGALQRVAHGNDVGVKRNGPDGVGQGLSLGHG